MKVKNKKGGQGSIKFDCSACGYSGKQKKEIMVALPKMTQHIFNNPPSKDTGTQKIEAKQVPLHPRIPPTRHHPSRKHVHVQPHTSIYKNMRTQCTLPMRSILRPAACRTPRSVRPRRCSRHRVVMQRARGYRASLRAYQG